MSFIRLLFLAFIAAVLLVAPCPAESGLGPLIRLRGEGTLPPDVPHETIRLESQEVYFRLRSTGCFVNALFNLFNEGETTTESMGLYRWLNALKWFPSRWPPFGEIEGSINGTPIRFNEEWDLSRSRELPRTILNAARTILLFPPEMKVKEQRQWLVSRLTFPGHARTTIRLSYYESYQWDYPCRIVSYWYGSAYLWKGTVGKTHFIIDTSDVGGTEMISVYVDQRLGRGAFCQNVKSATRLLGMSTVCSEFRDFDPHPAAELVIRLNEKRESVRFSKPVGVPPAHVVEKLLKRSLQAGHVRPVIPMYITVPPAGPAKVPVDSEDKVNPQTPANSSGH